MSSSRNEVIMAHLFLIATQFCAVVVYVLGKKILSFVDPSTFVFMRLLFVVPVVLIFAWVLTRKIDSFKVPWKSMLWIALSGVVGLIITQSLMFSGLNKSTAINTSIISAPCTPLFTALFSIIRGTDKLNIPKGLGFISSITGAMLLLQVWNFKFEGTTLGNLLIVGSSICSATNSLIQKHILNAGHHPLVVQSYICVSGILMYMIVYAPQGLFESTKWDLPSKIWMFASIVGVVATALPWCLGIIALKHTSPMTMSVYVILQPLIAGVWGTISGEMLTGVQILGGALVLLGLVMVNFATPLIEKWKNRQKVQAFELLSTEDEKGVELSSLSEKDIEVSTTNEIRYELSQSVETNAFVIEEDDDVSTRKDDYEDFKEISLSTSPHAAIVVVGDGADEIIISKDGIPTAALQQPILVA